MPMRQLSPVPLQPTLSIDERSGAGTTRPSGAALTTRADPSTRTEVAVRLTSSFRIIFLLHWKIRERNSSGTFLVQNVSERLAVSIPHLIAAWNLLNGPRCREASHSGAASYRLVAEDIA